MSNLPSMIEVLDFICVPHYPQKHWSISIVWGVTNCLNEVVLAKTSLLMQKTKYILISCDKVTSLYSQSWISVHANVIKDWDWFPLLMVLKRIVDGSSSDNMKLEIVEHVMEIGGLSRDELGNKVVIFVVDDVSVF